MARRLDRRRRDLPSLQFWKNRARALYRKICRRIIVWSGRIDTGAASLGLLFRTDLLFWRGIHQSLRRQIRFAAEGKARPEALRSGHEKLTARSIQKVKYIAGGFEDAHRQ